MATKPKPTARRTKAPKRGAQASRNGKLSKRRRAAKPRGKAAPDSDSDQPYATLAGLVDTLGADVFRILLAPSGLDIKVTEPVIFDSIDRVRFEPGDIVLGIGIGTEDRQAGELIKQAAASKAAAVVFKIRNGNGDLTETAQSANIALVGVDSEMTWNQLHALVRTAIASTGEVPEAGAGGVPVGDLFALANAVAAMVGGPTTIEDPQSRVLAFSSLDEPIDDPRRDTILGRRVPEPWMKRLQEEGIFRKLWSTDDVIEVDLNYKGLRRRLAIAVRAGGEILGSIWVAEGRERLGRAAEEALREAARIAALHLIRYRASEDIERRMRGDLLRAVLEGRGPVEHIAYRLGIEAKSPFSVIGFETQATEEAAAALERERTLELVSLYAETFHRRAACVSIDRTIYTLLPTTKDPRRDQLVGLASRVVAQAASSLGIKLRAGIGSTVLSLRDADRSRSEADQVLRVLGRDPKSRTVAGIEDLRAHTLLLEFQDLSASRPHLRSGRVQNLMEYDTEHGTSYVLTLRAYLDAFGDIGEAATSVNVHPNTFRYRVRRLSELSGLDLSDPDERLAAEIQLRLL